MSDPRRHIPRTDALLALAESSTLSQAALKAAAARLQDAARRGDIAPGDVEALFVQEMQGAPHSQTPVINATGVVVHTNVGRAPLGDAAVAALVDAAGYVDVEMDLTTGLRSSTRGAEAVRALLDACPSAEDALVVNNGAAALLLATTALAEGSRVVISRGEMIEIGAGFRLPELIESARVELVEVGATNRTHPRDYAAAAGQAAALLKVHPSNYRVHGFTAEASVSELREIADEYGLALIVDTGSGLLHPDPALPDEPDADTALREGADIVLFSGDKLLGGPQAGVILGRREAVAVLKKHPLARAVRIDKLRLAALEAAVRARSTPVHDYVHADPDELKRRTDRLAEATGGTVVPHDGRVGGGGAPGHPLPGWAVAVPGEIAPALRGATPAIIGRVHDGELLLDLRCVPAHLDDEIAGRVRACMS
ncbi:L-seryl-tRNA(Sec) selenium transferase [Corynebacterium sp. LK2510]|uniref:L-seryl-tRNA(Sec) selenium transferase n=1 Tax=Corynebacterium sp. LK2510 TaxID=3110472 RepID=UPI0034CD887B